MRAELGTEETEEGDEGVIDLAEVEGVDVPDEVVTEKGNGDDEEESGVEYDWPVRSGGDGTLLDGGRFIGGAVFVVGIGLLIGNVSGLFPTFPYAGYIVMSLGAGIWAAAEVLP